MDAYSPDTALAPAATTTSPRIVTGSYLAKAHLDPVQRAEIALDLAEGGLVLVRMTITQAASLTGAAEPTVRKIRRHQRQGAQPKDLKKITTEYSLSAAWVAATEESRREFVRQITPEAIFDTITAVL